MLCKQIVACSAVIVCFVIRSVLLCYKVCWQLSDGNQPNLTVICYCSSFHFCCIVALHGLYGQFG